MTLKIKVETMHYKDLNEQIHEGIRAGEKNFELTDVYGQRYIGDALLAGNHIDIFGTPGNDLAAFMDGATIDIHGNAQDQIGNTMNEGRIVVRGRCGDAAGYAMRGGSIYIEGDCGWRTGIHMKEYQDKRPTIVIGGDAGSFLGEYMAGGIILLMGKPDRYLATGMHGGIIYLAEPVADRDVNPMLVQEELEDYDVKTVEKLLGEYNALFGADRKITADFRRLRPKSCRPYDGMYT